MAKPRTRLIGNPAASDPGRAPVLVALIALATLTVFGAAAQNGFVDFDDGVYILENRRLHGGITLEALAWAFTSFDAANWHPLTWLSHLLDVQLFGMRPAGHHLVSALLHAANAGLLFLALHRMTGARWRSAFVAALFAVHPLRVESVAWASERKDVLSGLFWMLGLLAYERYLRRPGAMRYLALAAAFALGLLAKPMVVTFPLVLLLLDAWPFGRFAGVATPGPAAGRLRALAPILLEKIPLLALAAAVSIVTYLAQSGGDALRLTESFHAGARHANVVVSYAWYLGKFVLPLDLAAYYPMPMRAIPLGRVVAASVPLAALSLLALAWWRRRPHLALGWLWFLGTFVPVIGIVKTGAQSYADRYTYLPLIGISLAAAWIGADALRRLPRLRAGAAALVLLLLAALTVRQIGHWRDTAALWGHAVRVTSENWLAGNNYAIELMKQGRDEEALVILREAERSYPDGKILTNIALIFDRRGDAVEAGNWYTRAVARGNAPAGAYYGLGNILAARGRNEEAVRAYREAVRLLPAYSEAWNNMAVALARLGRPEEAGRSYAEAVRANPANAEARNNYGVTLFQRGLVDEAIREYREAIRLKPNSPSSAVNLADALAAQGRREEARRWYLEALRLDPGSGRARAGLSAVH